MQDNSNTTKHTDSAAELAVHISAILNHPATPANVHNALVDAVGEHYASHDYYNTVNHIAACLAHNIRKGDDR